MHPTTAVPPTFDAEQALRRARETLDIEAAAILGLKEYLRVAPRMDEQGAIDYARSLHSMVNTSAAMKKKSH